MNISLSDRDFQNARAEGAAGSASGVVTTDFLRRPTSWHRDVVDTLCRYLELPGGWDGYDGRPLRYETGMFALRVLNVMLAPSTPSPHVVPVADGGVQLEWHQNQMDIELFIASPYECELTVHDLSTGRTTVSPITSDFAALNTALKELVNYNRHLGPTANAG